MFWCPPQSNAHLLLQTIVCTRILNIIFMGVVCSYGLYINQTFVTQRLPIPSLWVEKIKPCTVIESLYHLQNNIALSWSKEVPPHNGVDILLKLHDRASKVWKNSEKDEETVSLYVKLVQSHVALLVAQERWVANRPSY